MKKKNTRTKTINLIPERLVLLWLGARLLPYDRVFFPIFPLWNSVVDNMPYNKLDWYRKQTQGNLRNVRALVI